MRIYDPRLGRFLSVDPIANQYPNLTPYQFASNTPIKAIDQDGLEAFFVHGTASSSDERWTKVRNADNTAKEYYENVAAIMKLTNNKSIKADFEWRNGSLMGGLIPNMFNNQKDRASAATQLANYVLDNLNGEVVTLIDHSHGGNVAIQAATIIREALDQSESRKHIKINLITIATPAYNGSNDPENPANALANGVINDHLHIYNNLDEVQVDLANLAGAKTAERSYNNGNTRNVNLNVDRFYKKLTQVPVERNGKQVGQYKYKVDGKGAHSFDFQHPEVIEDAVKSGQLKKPNQ